MRKMRYPGLASRVREARIAKGMSQREVSRAMGLTEGRDSYVREVERGLVPSSPRMVELADALGVKVEWLLTGEGGR